MAALSRQDFKHLPEGVVNREPTHATESSFCTEFFHFGDRHSRCAQPFATFCQRGGQAVEYTGGIAIGAHRTYILFQLGRCLDLDTEIGALWLQGGANRAEETTRVGCVMNNQKGGYQIIHLW